MIEWRSALEVCDAGMETSDRAVSPTVAWKAGSVARRLDSNPAADETELGTALAQNPRSLL
jgi:hypothetical protein